MDNNDDSNKLSVNVKVNIQNTINNIHTFEDDEKYQKIVVEKISVLLSNICEDNIKEHNDNNLIKPFLTSNPSISIKDYLERLCKYNTINVSTIILILIYIDRICNIYKFKLKYNNIHKLILSSMAVAIKYNEDIFYSTIIYSKLGGISNSEMIFLEHYFVILINFKLFVKEELFKKYNDYFISFDNEEKKGENEEEDSSEKSNNNKIINYK